MQNSDIERQALSALVAMQHLTDNYTPLHEDRVAQLAVRIAQQMNLASERIEAISMAAAVHDIGKVDIPLKILNKPGRLTAPEFELIKTHVQISYDILQHISFSLPVPEIVWGHHEYMDGSGYPRGISGDQILLESRILTVADIVESMSEDRPYRKSLGMELAVQEIKRLSGNRLDPDVVEACLQVV